MIWDGVITSHSTSRHLYYNHHLDDHYVLQPFSSRSLSPFISRLPWCPPRYNKTKCIPPYQSPTCAKAETSLHNPLQIQPRQVVSRPFPYPISPLAMMKGALPLETRAFTSATPCYFAEPEEPSASLSIANMSVCLWPRRRKRLLLLRSVWRRKPNFTCALWVNIFGGFMKPWYSFHFHAGFNVFFNLTIDGVQWLGGCTTLSAARAWSGYYQGSVKRRKLSAVAYSFPDIHLHENVQVY